MKINVISLQSAVHRRQSISQQFDHLDTAFDFFDAVQPPRSRDHIEGYNEREFMLNCGRAATDTEIACYASHLALWQQCSDEGTPYLILEDDAQLDESFLTGLFVTTSQIQKLGFIRVSLPELKRSTMMQRLGPFDIHYCQRAPLLALGYALSPRVAGQLVEAGKVVEEPVDKFLQRFWRFRQPVFAVVPPFIALSEHADDSNIGPREMPGLDAGTWIRRAGRKLQNSVSRALYNAEFLSEPNVQLERLENVAR